MEKLCVCPCDDNQSLCTPAGVYGSMWRLKERESKEEALGLEKKKL